jgi:hypothetical protein|eukprot:COSAG01_NODE_1201_length_11274_cov_639.212349_5_plen_131_part_00
MQSSSRIWHGTTIPDVANFTESTLVAKGPVVAVAARLPTAHIEAVGRGHQLSLCWVYETDREDRYVSADRAAAAQRSPVQQPQAGRLCPLGGEVADRARRRRHVRAEWGSRWRFTRRTAGREPYCRLISL